MVYTPHNHTSMPTISTIILFANSAWDLISSISILQNLTTHRCLWLADAHLALWTDDANRTNHAASAVMAALLVQWALVRLRGALAGPLSDAACVDASFTYALEAVMVAAEVAVGNMHGPSGWFVVMACVVCWALVVRECVDA